MTMLTIKNFFFTSAIGDRLKFSFRLFEWEGGSGQYSANHVNVSLPRIKEFESQMVKARTDSGRFVCSKFNIFAVHL